MPESTAGHETITLGGGCFWCLEAVYDQMRGVQSVESGYMGGHMDNPTYEAICTGQTGHAEVVQVTFDPAVVSFREILEVFFVIHDPTTLNRQGNDTGTQYRSVIFYHSDAQRVIAREVMDSLTKEQVFSNPLVTEVVPATIFYMAESYHQEYYANNPQQPYCTYVVSPKVAKFREKFLEKVKS